jgi:hypothetical protein
VIPKITVTFIDESDGYRETYNGFLTDPQHAMYVESKYGILFFGRVIPTDQDGFYKTDDNAQYVVLGDVAEGEEEHTIKTLYQVLKEKSAYDFLIDVMIRIPVEIDFNDLIVPGLASQNQLRERTSMPEFWKKIFHRRGKTAAELQANKHFDEIGKHDPFLLARHLGVQLTYGELGQLVGAYKPDPSNPDKQQIYINKDIDHESQEDVVFELMMHHIENRGVEYKLNTEELRAAVKLRRKRMLWWL